MPIPTEFPYTLTRMGVIMTPEEGNNLEAEGVLNPGTGHTADGTLYLLTDDPEGRLLRLEPAGA